MSKKSDTAYYSTPGQLGSKQDTIKRVLDPRIVNLGAVGVALVKAARKAVK